MEKEKATIVLLLLEKKISVLTVYDLTLVRHSGREEVEKTFPLPPKLLH